MAVESPPAPPAAESAPHAASAPSAEAPARDTRSNWPNQHVHLVLAATLGSCTRTDVEVAASGFCPEFSVAGLDAPIGRRWHLGAELGLGWMPTGSTGDSTFGIARNAGGTYAVLRLLAGLDVTRLFFVRAGVQSRATWSLETVAPGFQGVVDLGTRLGNHVELGLRALAGADGEITRGASSFPGQPPAPQQTKWSLTPAFEEAVVARVFIP